jgi:hypothetical protein
MSWIEIEITDKMIEKAKKIREMRDKIYGNIFEEKSTDIRWCGDLGEICFNNWIKTNGILKFDWILENAAGKGDFKIKKTGIDVKTVKRKAKPRNNYTAQITAKHKDTPVDDLFFMCYEYDDLVGGNGKMWLLGGCSKNHFINNAKYYSEGDYVHKNYQIRKGHEIYNAEFNVLNSPNNWLKSIS